LDEEFQEDQAEPTPAEDEVELKKKIALYYHQMVSNFDWLIFFILVLKLPCSMVCAPAAGELLKAE